MVIEYGYPRPCPLVSVPFRASSPALRYVFRLPRRRKDWMNSTVGGLSAGAAVAMLSKHTRQPRQVAAHAVGAAVITSIVALVSGSTGLGGDII